MPEAKKVRWIRITIEMQEPHHPAFLETRGGNLGQGGALATKEDLEQWVASAVEGREAEWPDLDTSLTVEDITEAAGEDDEDDGDGGAFFDARSIFVPETYTWRIEEYEDFPY